MSDKCSCIYSYRVKCRGRWSGTVVDGVWQMFLHLFSMLMELLMEQGTMTDDIWQVLMEFDNCSWFSIYIRREIFGREPPISLQCSFFWQLNLCHLSSLIHIFDCNHAHVLVIIIGECISIIFVYAYGYVCYDFLF